LYVVIYQTTATTGYTMPDLNKPAYNIDTQNELAIIAAQVSVS